MDLGQGDDLRNRRVRVLVRGRVQGVSFRAATRAEARRLGVSGWVRNEDDGSVLLEAWGPADAVAALLTWCGKGPPLARVSSLETCELPVPTPDEGGPSGFEIRYA